MKPKTLSILAIATLVAVLGAAWAVRTQRASHRSSEAPEMLFVGLKDRVNDVAKVTIQKGDQSLAIERTPKGWVLPDRDEYPAAFGKVKAVIMGMADLSIVGPRTSKPELLKRIGLEDPTGKDATSTQVTLLDEQGATLASVIVGQSRPGAKPQVFVRRGGEDQSWLVRGQVDASASLANWIDPKIIDIPRDRVALVAITHPDGEQVTVFRDGREGKDFRVADVPEGRELRYASVANPIGAGLSMLNAEDVRKADGLDVSSATRVQMHTFDGLVVRADLVDADGKTWAMLSAQADDSGSGESKGDSGDDSASARDSGKAGPDQDGAKDAEGSPDEDAEAGEAPSDADETSEAEETSETDEGAEASAASEAEAINARLGGWAFAIPGYKADTLRKRMEDLLKAVEKKEPEALGPVPSDEGDDSSTALEPDGGS